MTRTELLATLARRLNKNTTLDSATSARLLDYLNEVNRQVLSIPGSERLRKATVTISATADRANYTVYDCSRILRVVDRTNQRVLPEMALGTYRDVAPDPAEWTGTPTHFVNTGPRATAMDPSDASTLLVKSDSAADTTQTAYIEGVVSGFTPARTSTTLTGTTAAAFGGTWVRVDAFYLSAAGAGNITLHEDTGGGTQLSSIVAGSGTSTVFAGVTLYPTPSASQTLYVDILRNIGLFNQTTSVSDIPPEFHYLLIYGAMALEYEHVHDDRAGIAMSRYDKRLKEFKYSLAETVTGDTAGFERPSRLGAWFSSGGA
jgi:hypothetical protein